MTPRNLLILLLVLLFAGGIVYALQREVAREEARIRSAVSGVVQLDAALFASGLADVEKTDRIVLYLVDVATGRPSALRIDTPFVPPQTIIIGREDANGPLPDGDYWLVGLTDKDGEIFRATPGEVYGRSVSPVRLGQEQVTLVLQAPFRGGLFNGDMPPGMGGAAADPALTISGTVRIAQGLAAQVIPGDRLVLLVFDQAQQRPVAIRQYAAAEFPLTFAVAVTQADVAASPGGFYLRAVTDRDGQPVHGVPGELAGRLSMPVVAGRGNVEVVLDQHFEGR